MADEPETESGTVTTIVDIPSPESEPDESPAVVVVESGDHGTTDHVIDHAERLAQLEAENAEMRERLASAEATADIAAEVSANALDAATAEPEPVVIEPEPVPEPEPDVEPSRDHAWFKSWR